MRWRLVVLGVLGVILSWNSFVTHFSPPSPLVKTALASGSGDMVCNQDLTLSWSSTNATSCSASVSGCPAAVSYFSGSVALNAPPANPITIPYSVMANCPGGASFTISCSGPGGTVPDTYTVNSVAVCGPICTPPVGSACHQTATCGLTNNGTIQSDCSCNATLPVCPPGCDPDAGKSCTVTNTCGASNTGELACDGKTCNIINSVQPLPAPPLPINYGNNCTNYNTCGMPGNGNIDCLRTCDGVPPANSTCPVCAAPAFCVSGQNVCGAPGSGTVQCDATCGNVTIPPNPLNYLNSCPSGTNNCGDVGYGFIDCSGCNAVVPANRSLPCTCSPNQGQACQSAQNVCGQKAPGVLECDGVTCDATVPPPPLSYGTSCFSAENNCHDKNQGTVDCNGICNAIPPGPGFCPPPPVCGNASIEGTEQCDDGQFNNGVWPRRCSSSCTLNPNPPPIVCGNGIIEGTEQCDDNGANGVCPARCNTSCQINNSCGPICGDGNVDPGEECDLLGSYNTPCPNLSGCGVVGGLSCKFCIGGPPPPPVACSITPLSASIPVGGSTSLSWSSTGANFCQSMWDGQPRSLVGGPISVGPIMSLSRILVMQCTGAGGGGTCSQFVSAPGDMIVCPATATVPVGFTQQYESYVDSSLKKRLNNCSDITLPGISKYTNSSTWSSAALAIASVSDVVGTKGLATGNAVGSTMITADAVFGISVSASAIINVTTTPIFKVCYNNCSSSQMIPVPPLAIGMLDTDPAKHLVGCFNTAPDCTDATGNVTASTTWNDSNNPTDAATLSAGSGDELLSPGSLLGTNSENMSATYSGSTQNWVVTVTKNCISTCDPNSPVAKNTCIGDTYPGKDNCANLVLCDGQRVCDFNWKEIAP